MNGTSRLAAIAAAAGGLLVTLAAAGNPLAFSQAEGGMWEISRAGAQPVRLCIADPGTLAQFEHLKASCKRDLLRESGSTATISYTCAGGGFGHSTVTVLTPRSLRVETQGIADNAPFKYVFQARRVGNCPAH